MKIDKEYSYFLAFMLFIIALVAVFVKVGVESRIEVAKFRKHKQRGLLHGVDTCYVIARSPAALNELNMHVQYKDKIGVWHTDYFRESDVVLIP